MNTIATVLKIPTGGVGLRYMQGACQPKFRESYLESTPSRKYIDIQVTNCRNHQGTYISDIFEPLEHDDIIEAKTCGMCKGINIRVINSQQECTFCGGYPDLELVTEEATIMSVKEEEHKFGYGDVIVARGETTGTRIKITLYHGSMQHRLFSDFFKEHEVIAVVGWLKNTAPVIPGRKRLATSRPRDLVLYSVTATDNDNSPGPIPSGSNLKRRKTYTICD